MANQSKQRPNNDPGRSRASTIRACQACAAPEEWTARKEDASSRWQLGLANLRIRCVFTLCRRPGRGATPKRVQNLCRNEAGPCRCLSDQRAKRHWFLLLQESSTTIVSSLPLDFIYQLIHHHWWIPSWGWSPTQWAHHIIPWGQTKLRGCCSCGMETATICLTYPLVI